MLSNLDMKKVYLSYQQRESAHLNLVQFFQTSNINAYTDLALGVSRPEGNYSASEHDLGPQILHHNTRASVFELARKMLALHDAHHIPTTIYRANMPYLRISVGSEMAMMLSPDKYWVGNVRTIYSHLLVKHCGNKKTADEELSLYKDPDGSRPSEMEYQIWRDIYLSLEKSLQYIASLGNAEAKKQGALIGNHIFMWADAICSYTYADHA